MKFKAGELKGKSIEEIEKILLAKHSIENREQVKQALMELDIVPNEFETPEEYIDFLTTYNQFDIWEAGETSETYKAMISPAATEYWQEINDAINGRR